MSALDGWIDVCRAGTWRDTAGREVALDQGRLDRIVAAHGSADPAPVVVGHPETDAPAFAWIDGLRREGDRLQAKLRDIAPAFRDAVETGRYAGRSIALQGDTLRHLGFLGGRAPAVPGLAPTQFSSRPEAVLEFAADGEDERWKLRAGWTSMARLARSFRDWLIEQHDIETADRVIPGWEVEQVTSAAEAIKDVQSRAYAAPPMPGTVQIPPNDREEGAMPPKTEAELAAETAELATREQALAARETTLAAGEAAQAAADRLRKADEALKPHVEAGRVLPAERAPLAALLASLPDGDDHVIAFAGPDAAGEVREKPAAMLERFLAGLPKRVEFATLAGGAVPQAGGEDTEAIAAEARALMSEEADKGVTLTAVQAVDRVRTRRGLPTGTGDQP